MSRPRRRRAGAPVLVFVHGAYGSPWMWGRHLMPQLARHGIESVALRLPGAGGSPMQFPGPGLQDYVRSVAGTVREIGREAVVVGHSLGALVAQLALESVRMAGLVLLAPVPPTGMASSSLRLAVTAPGLWASSALSAVDAGFASVDATRDALFRRDTPAHVVRQAHGKLLSQPMRPLLEAQWPQWVARAHECGVPASVLAAEDDRIIDIDLARRTAAHHGCDLELVRDSGHAVMLDSGWPQVDRHLRAFLQRIEH